MSIEVRNIRKAFGNFVALDDVSLDIPTGELVALLGPSGSGKTTLLRIIAGLEIPDSGAVHLEGEEATHRSVRDRGVGFVFQHYALFRHMTVFENVAFGLRVRPRGRRPPEIEIRERVNRLLKLVQLEWSGERYPSQLSGGQRQRIALARAWRSNPRYCCWTSRSALSRRVIGSAGRKDGGSAAGRSIVAALTEEPARPPIPSGGRLACRNFPLLPDRCKTSGSWHPVHPGPLAQIGLSVTMRSAARCLHANRSLWYGRTRRRLSFRESRAQVLFTALSQRN